MDDGEFLAEKEFRAAVQMLPLIAIDLLVFNPAGDKVLLGLRRNPPAQGTWFVPGGRIRKGERLQSAWRRLCQAELGVDPPWSAAQFVGLFEHFYPDNFLGEPASTHYVVHAYKLVVADAVTDFPQQQHERFAWWSLETLINHNQVHPYTRAYFSSPRDG